ncbi:MAG: MoaD/ThiS family protein [Desulfurococcus sp.]|nr:MoaD/ThiS family protein [Desulfurococcus sp.]
MKVFVKLLARIAEKAVKPEAWIHLNEDSTLQDLLERVAEELGVKVDLNQEDIVILVNGRSIEFLNGVKTKLRDEDVVVIMPPAAGG